MSTWKGWTWAVWIALSGLLPSALPVQAGGATGGAHEITQIANNLQLIGIQLKEIDQLSRLAQQISNQQRMIDHMATQAKHLSQSDWGRAFSDLQRLNDVVRQGRALAYSYGSLDQMMRRTYPGYDTYTQAVLNRDTFEVRLSDWNRTTMDTMQGSLQAAQLQASQFDTEESTMQTLQDLSQSAVGRMQAIQAGNQIAAQQVRQTQKLRQLVMAQMGMQAAFMAGQEDKDAAQHAAYERFMRPTSRPVIGDEQRY
jgi:P-type conjugative transfer protein TrbJ